MTQARNVLVLLVDDEPLVLLVATESLEDAGFEVVEAADAAEALVVLRSRSDVGVLFTDVNMPGQIDGLDLAELVHRHWPSIKLVVTSGRGLARSVPDEGRFMGKPYSMREMTDLIGEVSQRHRDQSGS
jgi:CheY-like chemotaxis protein